jgi:hypothetical protein
MENNKSEQIRLMLVRIVMYSVSFNGRVVMKLRLRCGGLNYADFTHISDKRTVICDENVRNYSRDDAGL